MSDYVYKNDKEEIVVETRGKRISDKVIDQLIAIRKANHITQQDIANATGMQRANIARIEGKRYAPTLDVLARYAECLGVELEMRIVEK